jgi:hypothetical protein
MAEAASVVIEDRVCVNADCRDYGCVRRTMVGDRCNWCGEEYHPQTSEAAVRLFAVWAAKQQAKENR